MDVLAIQTALLFVPLTYLVYRLLTRFGCDSMVSSPFLQALELALDPGQPAAATDAAVLARMAKSTDAPVDKGASSAASVGVEKGRAAAFGWTSLSEDLEAMDTDTLADEYDTLYSDEDWNVASEMLLVLTLIATELPKPPYDTHPQGIAETLRREIVHKLAAGSCTYNELCECTNQVAHWSRNPDKSCLDAVINDLASKKESVARFGSSWYQDAARFALKPEHYPEYDPCFFHISQLGHQKAMEGKPIHKGESAAPFVGYALPSAHPLFTPVRNLFGHPILLELVRQLLTFGNALNSNVTSKLLQILTIGVHLVGDPAWQSHGQVDPRSFLRSMRASCCPAAALTTSEDAPCFETPKRVAASHALLKADKRAKSASLLSVCVFFADHMALEDYRAGFRWIATRCCEMDSASHVLFKPWLEKGSKQHCDTEALRKQAQERALAFMRQSAESFMRAQADDDMDTDEEDAEDALPDQDPDAMPADVAAAAQKEGQKRAQSKEAACIVCADGESEELLAYIGYAGLSTVLAWGASRSPDCVFDKAVNTSTLLGGFVTPTAKTQQFGSGMHLQMCGHVVHFSCFDTYFATMLSQLHSLEHISLDIPSGEFQCPLCKCVANLLIPVVPPALDACVALPTTVPMTPPSSPPSRLSSWLSSSFVELVCTPEDTPEESREWMPVMHRFLLRLTEHHGNEETNVKECLPDVWASLVYTACSIEAEFSDLLLPSLAAHPAPHDDNASASSPGPQPLRLKPDLLTHARCIFRALHAHHRYFSLKPMKHRAVPPPPPHVHIRQDSADDAQFFDAVSAGNSSGDECVVTTRSRRASAGMAQAAASAAQEAASPALPAGSRAGYTARMLLKVLHLAGEERHGEEAFASPAPFIRWDMLHLLVVALASTNKPDTQCAQQLLLLVYLGRCAQLLSNIKVQEGAPSEEGDLADFHALHALVNRARTSSTYLQPTFASWGVAADWFGKAMVPFLRCAMLLLWLAHPALLPHLHTAPARVDASLATLLPFLDLPSPHALRADASLCGFLEDMLRRTAGHMEVHPPLTMFPQPSALTLIPLTPSFTDLHAEKARLCSYNRPALCLVCAALVDADGHAKSTDHANECGGGTGVFLLLNRCTIILIRHRGAVYFPSPYIDEFGQEHRRFGPSSPLCLDPVRYEVLRRVWAHHQISREVISRRSTSEHVIRLGFY